MQVATKVCSIWWKQNSGFSCKHIYIGNLRVDARKRDSAEHLRRSLRRSRAPRSRSPSRAKGTGVWSRIRSEMTPFCTYPNHLYLPLPIFYLSPDVSTCLPSPILWQRRTLFLVALPGPQARMGAQRRKRAHHVLAVGATGGRGHAQTELKTAFSSESLGRDSVRSERSGEERPLRVHRCRPTMTRMGGRL